MTTRAQISQRISSDSFSVISSTIPPNVTCNEWRQARAAARPVKSPRLRLLIEALNVTPSLKRTVT
jgi:hypothetical protein